MSTGYFDKREKLYLDDLFWGLIASSHILHHHGILDAYGHVSVRNPDEPSHFFMSTSIAPALLSSVDDIIEYKIEDASPTDPNEKRKGFLERCIHSEIFKRFPSINAVVHSHCPDVLPYTINSVPLKASIHTTGFLGTNVPVWDIADAYSSMPSLMGGEKEKHNLLVGTNHLGHHLSAAFKPSTSGAFLYQKMRATLPSQLSSNVDPSKEPSHRVILMRGHGFTTCADSLEAVVFQSIYTKEAAKVQTQALLTNAAYFTDLNFSDSMSMEGTVNVGENGSGKIKGGKVKGVKVRRESEEVKFLSEREANDAWEVSMATMIRPWELWCREVEVNPLYRNNVKREGEEKA